MADWPRIRVTGVEDAADHVRRESLARLVRRGPLLIRWGTAPGTGNRAMLRCLVDGLGLNWADGADIQPAGDSSIIVMKGRRWCMVTLTDTGRAAHLEVDDGRKLELGVALDGYGADLHLPSDADHDEGTAPYLWARDPTTVLAVQVAVARLESLVGKVVEPGQLAEHDELRTAVGIGHRLYLEDDVLTLADVDDRVIFRLARVLYEGLLLDEVKR